MAVADNPVHRNRDGTWLTSTNGSKRIVQKALSGKFDFQDAAALVSQPAWRDSRRRRLSPSAGAGYAAHCFWKTTSWFPYKEGSHAQANHV